MAATCPHEALFVAHQVHQPAHGIAATFARPGVDPSAPEPAVDGGWPLFVCLLGGFGVFRIGRAVALRPGGKAEAVLSELALSDESGAGREELIAAVWPTAQPGLGAHSLDTLMSSLHRQFRDALAGSPPIVRIRGRYRLNGEAGVGVDLSAFDDAAAAGDAARRAADWPRAIARYSTATRMYRGDLSVGSDVRHVLERERLRARYLSIQAVLSDYSFAALDYASALDYARDLLAREPCREDAHRLAMRCYVRLGERAQAFRQYELCRRILRAEFDAEPEPATVDLWGQVRTDPAAV